MNKKRVLIGVPRWGHGDPEPESFRIQMAMYLGGRNLDPAHPYLYDWMVVPNVLIHFARELICKAAVGGGYDYVFMVDDDMNGPVNMIEKLIEDDVDIVSPLAFTRMGQHSPVVYGMIHRFIAGMGFQPVKSHFVLNYPRNTLFECAAVGFGAVLIKVEVLKRLPPPWFFTFKDDGTRGTGEDVWFCRLMAEKAGARIFCDSRIVLGHFGAPKWINEDTYREANPQVQELYKVCGDWSMEKSKEGLLQ